MVDVRRFVIQQHDATRLHWDLRLEHDGVLRSWALPRGVPWNPKENRLAVATEDHSLEFLDYEGDAADAGYGAGRMTNWDSGTFEAHEMEPEKVVVTLDGSRVSGKYALFSMRGTRDWLIHRMDDPADPDRRAVPIGIRPMRATEGAPPDGDEWAFEPRWHGIRATVTNDTGRVLIVDGSGDDVSVRFPEVRRIARAIGHLEVILDGVIVPVGVVSGRVLHDRRGLGRRLRITSDSGARNASRAAPVVFMAFDLLWVEGRPITGQPWELRRRRLDDLRLDGPGWRTSPVMSLGAALEQDHGVVAKLRSSPYHIDAAGSVTSPDWIEG
ncbi:MAG: DNA polymerase ligase N-terminal domain-containing protein [Ilumatobacter sp.]|uniref:DNA polymerase ligase N-terminal domain-containing protein n=1 Tax=Ilumatobacter sp. TaxID=1967498 RepID=UPI00261813BE|nr:DNA polymerase ligase N-terminal domain-containing protein [Ilumatobacter sp.]MDJ0770379.1 DNA polymerase ligase N-terminal domain-containing protein [Ilumatobacter sp.]